MHNFTKLFLFLFIFTTFLLVGATSYASDCNKHPRVGCPDTFVTNQFTTNIENIGKDNAANIAAATFAASIDLLPDSGKWRLDGALTNVEGENGAGMTLMHRFQGEHNWAMGVSAGISDGYEAVRFSGGLQF